MKKNIRRILLFLLMVLLVSACGKKPTESNLEEVQTSTSEIAVSEVQNVAEKDPQAEELTIENESAAEPQSAATEQQNTPAEQEAEPFVTEDGEYDSKEEVAAYIHLFGHLPGNYITKQEAEKLGWSGGGLDPYAPGKCIGGSRFGNYEGLLPEGKQYTECDIDTRGKKSRGAKRIVFSQDGLIFYTEDHYESFEQLY